MDISNIKNEIFKYHSLFNPKFIINDKFIYYLCFENGKCIFLNTNTENIYDYRIDKRLVILGIFVNGVFLLHDVISMNNVFINPNEINYETRFIILQNVYKQLENFDFFKIEIHPNIYSNNVHRDSLMNIFYNNFKYRNFYIDISKQSTVQNKKIIKDNNFSEIYNVYDIKTNNFEGLLRIKTLQDSINILEKYKNSSDKIFKCVFNHDFGKWQFID